MRTKPVGVGQIVVESLNGGLRGGLGTIGTEMNTTPSAAGII